MLKGDWQSAKDLPIPLSFLPYTYLYIGVRDKRRCSLSKIRYKTNGHLTNYRVAVGLLVGQGCERSELPCLADGITKLGRRSWSFYV